MRAIDRATVHHHDDDMIREDRSDVICREARFLLRSVVFHKRWWAEVQEIHAVKQSCVIFTYSFGQFWRSRNKRNSLKLNK